MTKAKNPLPRVTTEHRELTPEEWGRLCSFPWKYSARRVIGALFGHNGGLAWLSAAEAANRGADVVRTNRLLFKYELPYRIIEYELPRPNSEQEKPLTWADVGLRLETVIETH